MDTIFFRGKDGSVTSTRTGNRYMRLTSYVNNPAGGITFKSAGITSRFNNRGQCIGTGLKTGSDTTYFGKNGNVVNRITAFR